MARGCHQLIKDGAKLIESAADIIEELDLSLSSGLIVSASEKSVKIREQGLLNDSLLASVDYEITPVDIVVSRSKLPTDEVLTRLTMLELRGLVSAVPGGYLRLHRG
jgi:DNA processing protein